MNFQVSHDILRMSFGTMSINELVIGTLDWGAVPHSSTTSRPAEREMVILSVTVPRGLREDPARIALPGKALGLLLMGLK